MKLTKSSFHESVKQHIKKLDEIITGMNMVAEGIKNTRSAHELGLKMQVAMPITAEVYQILYEGKAPEDAVRELMSRDLKAEAVH